MSTPDLTRMSVAEIVEYRAHLHEQEQAVREALEARRNVENMAKALHALNGVEDFTVEAREWRVKAQRLLDYGFSTDELPRLARCFKKEG